MLFGTHLMICILYEKTIKLNSCVDAFDVYSNLYGVIASKPYNTV